jgi:hypothetical protein
VVELEEALFLDAGLLSFVGREILWQPGILAQSAPLAFTGSAVDLIYVDQYVLPVTQAALNFVPGDVGYISTNAYTLQVEPSTFSFSGANAPSMGAGVLVVENTNFEFTGLEVLFIHQRSMLVEPSPFYFTGSELGYQYEGSHRITVEPAILVLTPGTFGLSVGTATNEGRIDGANSYLIDQARGSVLLYPKDNGYFVISRNAA